MSECLSVSLAQVCATQTTDTLFENAWQPIRPSRRSRDQWRHTMASECPCNMLRTSRMPHVCADRAALQHIWTVILVQTAAQTARIIAQAFSWRPTYFVHLYQVHHCLWQLWSRVLVHGDPRIWVDNVSRKVIRWMILVRDENDP